MFDKEHCSDCDFGADGRSVTIGTGTAVGAQCFREGKHYWEMTAKECGFHSFVGICTSDPGDLREAKSGRLS